MALALCLTLLPAAALADEPAPPANEEPKQEQENQEQETQQEQQVTQQETQPAPTAAGEHTNHPICGAKCSHEDGMHSANAFTDAKVLKMESNGTLKMDDSEWKTIEYDGTTYLPLDAGSYYLGTDLTLDQYPILISGDVTLCLNGKSITVKENNNPRCVIMVDGDNGTKKAGHLTLTDCSENNAGTIRGRKKAAVEILADSNLNMYGGTITGSSIGVDISSGTFNMSDGSISGNSGRGVNIVGGTFKMSGGFISNNLGLGVFVGSDSEFNMSGGEITRNKGGVEVYNNNNASLTVSGAARITENTVNGKPNNVYLQQGKFFIAENLTGDALIGVTTAEPPTRSAPIKVAGVVGDYSAYIKSDQAGYTVQHDNNQDCMVLAIQEHKHCLCGKADCDGRSGHLKQETDFTPWTDALAKAQNGNGKTASNSLPKETGKWYLTGDVTLTGTWTPALNTVLCLNGHNITMNGNNITAIYVNNAFTLCDCKGGKDAYGQITHTAGMTGSGVNVLSGGEFHMYGGSISGNTADNGGGVYMGGGQFTMYGGSITKNTATNNGGGVYVNRGCKFDMNGGTIGGTNDGDANTANQGGGVCVDSGTFTMNGNASVSGNTAKNGGGVYASAGKFNMNGNASVMNNTATTDSGGVFVHWSATFTVSDRPTVTGNKNNGGAASNVYLTGTETTITIGAYGLWGNENSIGVTKITGSVIATATGNKDLTDADAAKFKSDKDGFVVSVDTNNTNNKKQLVLKKTPTSTHTHEWAYANVDKSTVSVTCKGTPGSCDYKTTPATVKISMPQSTYEYPKDTATPKATLTYSSNWPDVLSKAEEKDIKYWKSNDGGNEYKVQITDSNGLKQPGMYLAQLDFNGKWLEARFSVVDNSKQDPTYTAPTAKKDLVYTGTAQVLINEGSATGGEMQYRLDNGTYSTDLPTATNAGTYTVWYKVVDDATHNDVAERSIMVTIAKAQLSGTPTFTKVTEAGKTLKNVTLTKPESWPEGSFEWGDGATETSQDTQIVQGQEYWWYYRSANHFATGKIVPWANPSSGGGSTGGTTGGGSSSGGSSSGGSSSSDRDDYDSNPVIKTETKNNTDGSTTKTETRKDGSVTQTTTGKDGGVSKTETKPDGSSVTENKAADGSTGTVKTDKNGQTEAKTALSNKAIEDAKKNGEAVKAPVEVKASRDSSTAPTVKVELPKNSGETKVEIPVSNVKPGTVAVLVHPDGTEEILKDSIPTEDGIQLTVDGSATVKIVDNSKGFIDTRNHWAEDEIDFVSARGLINGMSDTIYAPNNSTTRAQLWTILARQNDANLNGGNIWYEKAQNWAKDKGVSDGANPNAFINRAQMVSMLWRAMGQPAAGSTANFIDVPADAYYAGAVSWAVENGITTGVGGGKFDPNGTCTRAQIAAFLARSMK